MKSKFVVSLDFELMWGVRDKRTIANYGDAIIGVRDAIPKMLFLFKKYNIRVTWAVVGLLFSKNRDEIHEYLPSILPIYLNEKLNPFNSLTNGEVGYSERDDLYHYAPSLIEMIKDCEGQEIATHTFSHYYCLEKGASDISFDADIVSACGIAEKYGITYDSIVFPRNQFSLNNISIIKKHGIKFYRGNPNSYFYSSVPQSGNNKFVRGIRFFDGVLPITGRHHYKYEESFEDVINIPASRFFRAKGGDNNLYPDLHLRHILRDMLAAAKNDGVYHLWWHPHNFGRNVDDNINRLDCILNYYLHLNHTYGMSSFCMRDFK